MAEPCYACEGDGYDPFVDGKSAGNCKRCKGGGTEPRKVLTRYKAGSYGAMVEDEDGRWLPREEVEAAIQAVINWCDERRNASDMTTLGAVQHKLRGLL